MPIVLKSSPEALLKYALPLKEDKTPELPEFDSSVPDARLHIYMCTRLLISPKLRAEFDYWIYIRSYLNREYAVKRGATPRVCRYFSHHSFCLHCGSCRRIKSSNMFSATCASCSHFPTHRECLTANFLSSEVNTMFWAVDRPYMDEFLDHYLNES